MTDDIGYHHIQTYHLHLELLTTQLIHTLRRKAPSSLTVVFEPDFDFTCEQREGWTYQ